MAGNVRIGACAWLSRVKKFFVLQVRGDTGDLGTRSRIWFGVSLRNPGCGRSCSAIEQLAKSVARCNGLTDDDLQWSSCFYEYPYTSSRSETWSVKTNLSRQEVQRWYRTQKPGRYYASQCRAPILCDLPICQVFGLESRQDKFRSCEAQTWDQINQTKILRGIVSYFLYAILPI